MRPETLRVLLEPDLLVASERATLHQVPDGLPRVRRNDRPGLLGHLVPDEMGLVLDALASRRGGEAHHVHGDGETAAMVDSNLGDDEGRILGGDFTVGDLQRGSSMRLCADLVRAPDGYGVRRIKQARESCACAGARASVAAGPIPRCAWSPLRDVPEPRRTRGRGHGATTQPVPRGIPLTQLRRSTWTGGGCGRGGTTRAARRGCRRPRAGLPA